jgi:hypothetical protein
MKTVELTTDEVTLLLQALETREQFLVDWGHAEGFWKTPAQKELMLEPLARLSRRLLNA